MYNKEEIYDNQISPLISEVLKICKENNIQMAMQFYLQDKESNPDGEPMYCTSNINTLKEDQIDYVTEAMRYGREGKPFVSSINITKG